MDQYLVPANTKKSILIVGLFRKIDLLVIGIGLGVTLVFALVFFLFFSGLFRRYTPLVAVSMIVIFIYGSTIWSIFPISEFIDASLSWEAHLSGAISGFLVALLYRKQGPQKPEIIWEDDGDLDEENEFLVESFDNDEKSLFGF